VRVRQDVAPSIGIRSWTSFLGIVASAGPPVDVRPLSLPRPGRGPDGSVATAPHPSDMRRQVA